MACQFDPKLSAQYFPSKDREPGRNILHTDKIARPSRLRSFAAGTSFSRFPLLRCPLVSHSHSLMASSKPRYFFKVFFHDRSTNSLRIPPAFSGQIVAESGRRVALRGPSGSVWKARLVKDSVGFLFEDGWKEFVENHALVMGDFLIFGYKGNSRFDVLVFDMTACEKKEAFLARPSVDNEIEVSDDEEEENKPLVHLRKRRLDENLKKENAVNDLLDESNSKRSKVSKCSPQSTKVRTTKKSTIYRKGSLISQRQPVTEEEVEKTHQRAISFKSEHPFAVAIMQDSYVNYMNVPGSRKYIFRGKILC